jgi:molybdopterin-guanine dinucleotide biosynthesis protein A
VGVAQRMDDAMENPHPHSGLLAAIILAGGTSQRMGTDKLSMRREGRSVLQTVIDEARLHVETVIVVGHIRDEIENVEWTMENPPGGGPLAGLNAALTTIRSSGCAPGRESWVALLAGDAPRGPRAIPDLLLAAARGPHQGALVVDASGRDHPLCAVYGVSATTTALANARAIDGGSMRSLIERLNMARVTDQWEASADLDTPADAQREGFRS